METVYIVATRKKQAEGRFRAEHGRRTKWDHERIEEESKQEREAATKRQLGSRGLETNVTKMTDLYKGKGSGSPAPGRGLG